MNPTKISTKTNLPDWSNCNIGIIGLGYVGLPLAVEFAKTKICYKTKKNLKNKIVGFDIDEIRLNDLKTGVDKTKEISKTILNKLDNIQYTNELKILATCDVYIVTVPTPIDSNKKPNLKYLEEASKTVGESMNKRKKANIDNKDISSPIVIYESTVYPGTTEEICIPILEQTSGLKLNNDTPNEGFYCGYSPERINPGDKIHTISSITKVTSGGDKKSAEWIDSLYSSIIEKGTHLASSIKVAEASKIIENTQRDLNIALINEFALIFNKLEIDTMEVLAAAGTKWNFLKFRPGLVGGHCISVDPYYLTYKSEQIGYYPEVVLAGRRINDSMSKYIVENLVKEMISRRLLHKEDSKILILGITFKENCCDIRNTKVIDIINELKEYKIDYDILDPWVNENKLINEYGLEIISELPQKKKYKAVILAVGHDEFKGLSFEQWQSLTTENGVYYDLHNIIPRNLNPIRL